MKYLKPLPENWSVPASSRHGPLCVPDYLIDIFAPQIGADAIALYVLIERVACRNWPNGCRDSDFGRAIRLGKKRFFAAVHTLEEAGLLEIHGGVWSLLQPDMDAYYPEQIELETPLPGDRDAIRDPNTPYNSRIRRLIERDGNQCHYCHGELVQGDRSVDHKVPRKFGGSNDYSNLVLACRSCNSWKRTRSYEWAMENVAARRAVGYAKR